MTPVFAQRLESALLAVAVLVAFVVTGAGWWWPLVLFLVFDLSALGYLRGPRLHALGYGLKLAEGFGHTHLGRIGKDRAAA